MRKRIITPTPHKTEIDEKDWLDLELLAEAEITSEDEHHPIESALLPGRSGGWRASKPGRQTVRLVFNPPRKLTHIHLCFVENTVSRTQEYVLRYSENSGQSFQEIVRQQWNFSPEGATNETEDYELELPSVDMLELDIIPDISGGNAMASLEQLRVA